MGGFSLHSGIMRGFSGFSLDITSISLSSWIHFFSCFFTGLSHSGIFSSSVPVSGNGGLSSIHVVVFSGITSGAVARGSCDDRRSSFSSKRGSEAGEEISSFVSSGAGGVYDPIRERGSSSIDVFFWEEGEFSAIWFSTGRRILFVSSFEAVEVDGGVFGGTEGLLLWAIESIRKS
jgi:hypothetical protein